MSSADTIDYIYSSPSTLKHSTNKDELFLSNYSEVPTANLPCFFRGKLSNPYIVARCLITLANVVKSRFTISQAEIEAMKDPIVTVGNSHIRFEGFSGCAGVYGRVDVHEQGQEDAFIASGTTNVDFNPEMILALNKVSKHSPLELSVGSKDVEVKTDNDKIVEKKVPLPNRWVKGLTSVQHYLSQSKHTATLNRMQTIALFRSIPKGKIKSDYYLIKRANRYSFSPMAMPNSTAIGGLERLRLLEPLLALITELKVFVHPKAQSISYQLYFDTVTFSLTISRDPWRGFSGEGALLEELMEEIDEETLSKLNNFSHANQAFSPTLLPIRIGKDAQDTSKLTAKLSALGLLGYDLDSHQYFYRQLSFKPSRILTLNPRLKGAKKLLEKKQVKIILNDKNKIEARVAGTGVEHLVIIQNNTAKCTCQWYSKYQGERGECKHVLAVREMVK